MNADELAALKVAYLTEVQAVAIYEAECWLLRRSRWNRGRKLTCRICLKTLSEEKDHQGWMETELALKPPPRALIFLNRLAGWIVGWGLALLPARLSWKIHAWAEGQAALSYRTARSRILQPVAVVRFLEHAESQEARHQRRFARLHGGIVPGNR